MDATELDEARRTFSTAIDRLNSAHETIRTRRSND